MPDMRFGFYEYSRSGILQILDDWELIEFEPEYQRKGGVWSLDKKQYYIDSIINGMDLTKLYLHALSPGTFSPGNVKYGVIDGKQRLEAIRGFVQDEFPLSHEFEYLHGDEEQAASKTYSQLLTEFPILRARFDDTILPVTVMQADDEVLIEGLFVRLNEQVTLNAAEKRNAFGGPIPLIIRELSKHRLFTHYLPFKDGRYRHRDLAAKFLWIVQQDRFVSTKRRDLDDFVKAYRLNAAVHPDPNELVQSAEEIADAMCGFFTPKDDLLQSVGWVTLYFHLFRLRIKSPKKARLSRRHFEQFVADVTAARQLVRRMADGRVGARGAQINSDLAQFDSLRQSLNDATALRTRYAILRRYVAEEFGRKLPEDVDSDH